MKDEDNGLAILAGLMLVIAGTFLGGLLVQLVWNWHLASWAKTGEMSYPQGVALDLLASWFWSGAPSQNEDPGVGFLLKRTISKLLAYGIFIFIAWVLR